MRRIRLPKLIRGSIQLDSRSLRGFSSQPKTKEAKPGTKQNRGCRFWNLRVGYIIELERRFRTGGDNFRKCDRRSNVDVSGSIHGCSARSKGKNVGPRNRADDVIFIVVERKVVNAPSPCASINCSPKNTKIILWGCKAESR